MSEFTDTFGNSALDALNVLGISIHHDGKKVDKNAAESIAQLYKEKEKPDSKKNKKRR